MKRIKGSPEKKILDVTCGGRSIWFNKHHPAAIYCDRRKAHYEQSFGKDESVRTVDIDPDIICDFTDLPFDDNTFSLVVFDPPHIPQDDSIKNAWVIKKYGWLEENWRQTLQDGFRECMRVLKPDGILIFKWSETCIPAQEVWDAIGEEPLFGHRSGKKSNTFWGCFMKSNEWQMDIRDFLGEETNNDNSDVH